MLRRIVPAAENTAAVVLPPEFLEKLGIAIGDEIDISIKGRTLILRPLDDLTRARKIEKTTKAVFRRRKSAYKRLAKETN